MIKNPDKCPHCGGENGFHSREIVDFKNYFCWDGSHVQGVHNSCVRGGKAMYCSDCGRNITDRITMPEGYNQ